MGQILEERGGRWGQAEGLVHDTYIHTHDKPEVQCKDGVITLKDSEYGVL